MSTRTVRNLANNPKLNVEGMPHRWAKGDAKTRSRRNINERKVNLWSGRDLEDMQTEHNGHAEKTITSTVVA